MVQSYDQHDAFWAQFLGVEVRLWQTPGVSVATHVGLAGYRGAWFFERNERIVVSAPSEWVARLEARCATQPAFAELVGEAGLRALFGAAFERSVGPAFQGALAPERFTPLESAHVRALSANDDAALGALCAACGSEDVDQSGVADAPQFRAGYFLGGEPVAVCGYRAWSDVAGDPCVLTHPDWRGRGHGAAVAGWTVARALAARRLLLYQTLESHAAAVGIARRLGFERYARHVAVRLHS
jgi:hypothetical protein